jgi:hypothetical protein
MLGAVLASTANSDPGRERQVNLAMLKRTYVTAKK